MMKIFSRIKTRVMNRRTNSQCQQLALIAIFTSLKKVIHFCRLYDGEHDAGNKHPAYVTYRMYGLGEIPGMGSLSSPAARAAII